MQKYKRSCVHKQLIVALYFEFENELKFYNLGASYYFKSSFV